MKRRFVSKLSCAVLALFMVFSVTACGTTVVQNGGGTGNETEISIINFGGGVGGKWLANAIERFTELKKDVEYESGKKGVYIEYENNISVGTAAMATSGYNIYFDQIALPIQSYIQQGMFMDITDIVTEDLETVDGQTVSIEDKIFEEERYGYRGPDGKYYCLPHFEFYDGATYDVGIFNKYGFYFAAEDESDYETFHSNIVEKDFKFVKGSGDKNVKVDGKKSCGNDGKYGTQDDGMPTTLEELVALCEYMKEEKGVTPFVVTGNHIDYSSYFMFGLWQSLAGYEQSSAKYKFSGTVDYVTGFDDNTPLFSGYPSIKAPKTATAEITEATGYLARDQVGRYYAAAFLEIANDRGWLDARSANNSFIHTDAMRAFVMNGLTTANPEVGMIMEGSYWMNEAEDNNIFEDYKVFNNGSADKNMAWFNLPTSFDEPVTEGNGREEVLTSGVKTYAFINANLVTRGTPGKIQACKDFLQFLYTDDELKNFIKQSGTTKEGIKVDINDDVLSYMNAGQKSFMEARANNRTVLQSGNNQTFISNTAALTYGIDSGFRPEFNGTRYSCYIRAYRAGQTAQSCFEKMQISKENWISSYYKGN